MREGSPGRAAFDFPALRQARDGPPRLSGYGRRFVVSVVGVAYHTTRIVKERQGRMICGPYTGPYTATRTTCVGTTPMREGSPGRAAFDFPRPSTSSGRASASVRLRSPFCRFCCRGRISCDPHCEGKAGPHDMRPLHRPLHRHSNDVCRNRPEEGLSLRDHHVADRDHKRIFLQQPLFGRFQGIPARLGLIPRPRLTPGRARRARC